LTKEKKKRNERSIRDCPNKPSSFLYEFELSEKRNERLSTKYTLRGKNFTVFFYGKDLGNQQIDVFKDNIVFVDFPSMNNSVHIEPMSQEIFVEVTFAFVSSL